MLSRGGFDASVALTMDAPIVQSVGGQNTCVYCLLLFFVFCFVFAKHILVVSSMFFCFCFFVFNFYIFICLDQRGIERRRA